MTFFIVEHAGGDVSYHQGSGPSPSSIGESEGLRWAEVPRMPAVPFERWDWAVHEFIVDLPVLSEFLAAAIDRERERRGAALLTPGESVSLAYARKAEEVTRFDGGEALSVERFPYLAAEAAARGAPLAAVATETLAALRDVDAAHAAIEAGARVAKITVREAGTEQAMRAAAEQFLEMP